MIITRLKGGLGNQIFQYEFGRRLGKKLNTSFKLDLISFLRPNKPENTTNRDYQLGIFNIEELFLKKNQFSNSVCAHFRRGDYEGKGVFNNFGMNYFKTVADYISKNAVYQIMI